MPKLKPQHILLVLALAGLTACDTQPMEPGFDAQARSADLINTPSGNIIYRDAATVPFSFVVYSSCANGGQGEVLQVQGSMEYRGHWFSTAQGERHHYFVAESITGVGTGWTTGEVYDIERRALSVGNTDYGDDGIPDSFQDVERTRTRMTSRTTGTAFDVIIASKYMRNAAGEYVVDSFDATVRCD